MTPQQVAANDKNIAWIGVFDTAIGVAGAAAGGAMIARDAAANEAAAADVGPAQAYNRSRDYGRPPTAADRKALGATPDDVVDHNPPLVQRYYEGDPSTGEKPGYLMTPDERAASASDRSRMQLQPRDESNSQGAEMQKYSRAKKDEFGL